MSCVALMLVGRRMFSRFVGPLQYLGVSVPVRYMTSEFAIRKPDLQDMCESIRLPIFAVISQGLAFQAKS